MNRVFMTAFVGLLLGVLQLSAQGDDEPAPKEESPIERAERILKEQAAVSKNLEQKDVGDATQKAQSQVLKDLDALLKSPPPPPSNKSSKSDSSNSPKNQPMPMTGNKSQSQPMPSDGPPMSRREKRTQQQSKSEPKNGQPMPMTMTKNQPMPMGKMGDPMPLTKNDPMQKQSPNGLANPEKTLPSQANRIAEMGKGIWGHLPETLRQEMDLYYRDQFMPRYGDLLREYYSSIAEGK